MLPRQQYKGSVRKLVLAFDIGTTLSGVSYCILDPGEVPVIQGVSRYPGQEHIGGDSKIPSIVYYDPQGEVRAVGAEALQERIIEQAEDEDWVKLEWWKLHFCAKHLESFHIQEDDIPPLPRGKSAVQVLADFMRYLFQCAQTYIQELYCSNLWGLVEDSIEFVVTHPNGWEGPQQQQIRRAVELAGLISSKEEQSHVHLLTEGEAILHFCVTNVIASDAFSSHIGVSDFPANTEGPSGTQGVVIVDAGDETIDLSAYSMKLSPTSFEEIAPAECCLQGSVFVTRRAHTLLKNKLSGSNYSSPEIITQMTSIFDRTTKLRFRTPDESSYIKFGIIRDTELKYDIRCGTLKLAGQDVAGLFEPSIQAIIEAFEKQKRATSTQINFVFLVGVFSASEWLFAKLQEYFQPLGISFCRPDSHVNKAVADGAISFYIDCLVSSGVVRATPFEQECWAFYTSKGDASLSVKDYDQAIEHYSAAMAFHSASDSIFAGRCSAKLGQLLWRDALLDAQKVIELNPSSYLGYQLKNAALHGAEQYDEAIEAFEIMLSKLNDTPDMQIQMLRQQYVSPSEARVVIRQVIDAEMANAPPRLVNTSAGCLCDPEAQIHAFTTTMEYKKLLSVTMKHANLRMEHIQEVVVTFFQYAMPSYRWQRTV